MVVYSELLMRDSAWRKKLFVCRAAFVWTALKHFPDLNHSNRQWPGWEGSVMILHACFRIQDSYRSQLEGTLHPIIFWKNNWCAPVCLWPEQKKQTIMAEIRMECCLELHQDCLRIDLIFFSCCRKNSICWAVFGDEVSFDVPLKVIWHDRT